MYAISDYVLKNSLIKVKKKSRIGINPECSVCFVRVYCNHTQLRLDVKSKKYGPYSCNPRFD